MKGMGKNSLLLYSLIFFLLLNSISSGQTYFGVRIEPFLYFSNIDKKLYASSDITKDHSLESNLGITFLITTSTSEELRVSFRTGFAFTELSKGFQGGIDRNFEQTLYKGINSGLYLSYYFSSTNYLISGVNLHFNIGGGGHSYTSEEVMLPYIVLGFGHHLTDSFPIEIQLSYPLNTPKYGTYSELFYFSNEYKLAWMLKLSLGFEFEL